VSGERFEETKCQGSTLAELASDKAAQGDLCDNNNNKHNNLNIVPPSVNNNKNNN